MDLEFSDDQLELRDNIRSVLEGICPPTVVRAVYDGESAADGLWSQMVGLYWPAIGVPEAAGGLGLGFVEVGLLAEELGRAAAPGPLLAMTSQYLPTLIAGEHGAAQPGVHLEAATCGNEIGALAYAESGRWTADAVKTTAVSVDGRWSITGTKDSVLGGEFASIVAVVARVEGDGLGVFLVERDGIDVAISPRLDPGLGLVDMAFEAAPGERLLAPSPATEQALLAVVEQATTAMALHTVGACRRIFEVTLDYAKVREQYDRVIGSFQALKHRFADMYLAVERANAVAYYAALAIAEDDPVRATAVHVAKAATGDCQRLLAEDGLQLHGGIGYTWEHDLHFLLKRAKAGEALCGSRSHHRAALASALGLGEALDGSVA